MNIRAGVSSTIKALLIFLGALVLGGALLVALSSFGTSDSDALKGWFAAALSATAFLVVVWSIRSGRTGIRMIEAERRSNPVLFWAIVLAWLVLGAVLLGSASKELRAHYSGYTPNNSFKPSPLRGPA